MGRIEKTFFISYRRTNYWTALAVYQDLTAHGYDVFFDYQNIDSGKFEKVIADNIKFRAHFVLILSASAAEIHFRKAIDIESTNALAYSNLGVLLGDLKQQDEAKSCYHKALNLIESSPAEDSAFYVGTYHNLKNSEIKFSEFSF